MEIILRLPARPPATWAGGHCPRLSRPYAGGYGAGRSSRIAPLPVATATEPSDSGRTSVIGAPRSMIGPGRAGHPSRGAAFRPPRR